MSGRRNPEKPDAWQKQIIRKAGQEPQKWLVIWENEMYLYLVDRGGRSSGRISSLTRRLLK